MAVTSAQPGRRKACLAEVRHSCLRSTTSAPHGEVDDFDDFDDFDDEEFDDYGEPDDFDGLDDERR